MGKKTIFISYDYDNDKHYKRTLMMWDKNKLFDFGFTDQSADVSVQSNDTATIKRVISKKINDATYFLCLVGAETSKSGWVDWEIEKAKELEKKLVAVKISPGNTSPNGLLNAEAKWAMSFTFDAIKNAIEGA